MGLFAKRNLKVIFHRLQLHKIVTPFQRHMENVDNLTSLCHWIEKQKPAFTSYPVNTYDTSRRYELFQKLVENESLNEMFYLEFGVTAGNSMRWWLANNKHPHSYFYGFDALSAIVEDLQSSKRSTRSELNEKLQFSDERVKLFSGTVQESFPQFLRDYNVIFDAKRKLIHLDLEKFSDNMFVLSLIGIHLKAGDILLFNHFNAQNRTFQAFLSFMEAFQFQYEVIAEANNYQQVAIKIAKVAMK